MTAKVGMACNDIATITQTAREIEQLGYDYLAVGEHLTFHVPTPNSMVMLSAAAAATSSIELVTTVLQLPLYPAALVAKMGAVLDVISGGRLNLGIGLGGENPAEFDACGVPVRERGARADEALEVITRLWTEQKVSFEGRFCRLDEVTLDPTPLRNPHPPIWVSGRKEPAIRRAARFGQWWMPYMITPTALAEGAVLLRREATARGRDESSVHTGLFIYVNCQADRAAARDEAVARLGAQYAGDYSSPILRYGAVGDPDDCIARLTEFVEAGAEAILLVPACPEESAGAMRALLANEVLPDVRKATVHTWEGETS